MYTFQDNLFSDLYKDVFGCRPGSTGMARWNSSSNDQKQAEWDYLLKSLNENMEAQRAKDAASVAAFEARVEDLIALGAADEATAIRWILEGLGLDEMDLMYGGDKVCYDLDLPFSMADVFNPICKSMLKTMEKVDA